MRLKKTSVFSRSSFEGSGKDSGRNLKDKGSHGNLSIRAFLFFISVLFFGSSSFGTTLICRSNKSVRTLRSDKSSGGGCRAVYTKEGVDQVVGSSTRENGCDPILQTIRKTLEAHQWKCKETKSGAVSNLSK